MSLVLPDFTVELVQAEDENFTHFSHQQISLPEYLQQKSDSSGLILYFYTKDNTAGCSVQAEDFSQYASEFDKMGYRVIGVSRDSIKSHEKFIANKHIRLALISDSDQRLCQYFGVIGEKNMYGKKVLSVVRSTFIFDKAGTLIHELRNVRAKGHVDTIKERLT